jgi:hypothetical protein
MRLINISSLELEEFIGAQTPPYAILSHTWETEEVTLQELKSSSNITKSKKGYAKIARTCDLTRKHQLSYAWVDTCCIDKSSSAELTEAINSMFQWYKAATVCFAYLSDLLPPPAHSSCDASVAGEELRPCRWFTRGWTLQELIAPKNVLFFDQAWNLRGTKDELGDAIQEITGIYTFVLQDSDRMADLPVSTRLSWASSRETTRVEDIAYFLLGIFDANMPLLYGEGEKSFIRLQHEIIKSNSDLSIFGWHSGTISRQDCTNGLCSREFVRRQYDLEDGYCGIFASFPKDFRALAPWVKEDSKECSVTNVGLRINSSLFELCLRGCRWAYCSCRPASRKYVLGISCTGPDKFEWGILLEKLKPDFFIRSSRRLLNMDGFVETRRITQSRPINLALKTPSVPVRPPGPFGVLKVLVDQELSFLSAVPESRWDSCNRHFIFEGLPRGQQWGLISLQVPIHTRTTFPYISVVFQYFSSRAWLLEDCFYKETISLVRRGGSEYTWEDVTDSFGGSLNSTSSARLAVEMRSGF